MSVPNANDVRERETPTPPPQAERGAHGHSRSEILVARSGYRFRIRPAQPDDEPALGEFFTHVTAEDVRFRFLSAVNRVGHDQLEALIKVDHDRTENFLAFDASTGVMIATAMMAGDSALERAEVAIAIRADFKHRGVGWALLDHVARYAKASGVKILESIESRDNHQAIELEREMGFAVLPCSDDPTLVIVRTNFAGLS